MEELDMMNMPELVDVLKRNPIKAKDLAPKTKQFLQEYLNRCIPTVENGARVYRDAARCFEDAPDTTSRSLAPDNLEDAERFDARAKEYKTILALIS